MIEYHPLHPLPPSQTSSSHSSSASTPLFGWLLCASSSAIDGRLSRCFNFLFYFPLSNRCPIRWYDSPHALQTGCASSLTLNLPLQKTPIFGWLFCLSLKFWLFKAKAPFSLYFLACVDSRPPNKPTNGGALKPGGECLACDHREWRRHDLLAPLTYPWRLRAKPLGVGQRRLILDVVCFVLFVLWCKRPFSYQQIGQNGRFLHTRRQKCFTKTPKC